MYTSPGTLVRKSRRDLCNFRYTCKFQVLPSFNDLCYCRSLAVKITRLASETLNGAGGPEIVKYYSTYTLAVLKWLYSISKQVVTDSLDHVTHDLTTKSNRVKK